MFCPQCKLEYRLGFTRCSDCGTELVDQLPPGVINSEANEELDYVVVATVQGALEEGQICSFLEANGIPAHVRGEGFRKIYALNVDGIGAAQILVPREHAIRALDLLAKADRGELEIDAANDETSAQGEEV